MPWSPYLFRLSSLPWLPYLFRLLPLLLSRLRLSLSWSLLFWALLLSWLVAASLPSLLPFRRAPSLLPPLSPESGMPASCRRVGLVSWSKGGRGVGWMGRCGVLDGVFGVLSPGLMRISVKKMVLRSFLRLGGVSGWV